MPQELTRDEGPGASPEAGSRPGARADVEEAGDGRAMTRLVCERPPEEVLVEGERARVRVALLEVDVRRLQIRRGERHALAYGRLEVRNVVGDPLLDAVRVPLAQHRRPTAVARVELAGSVALDVPGQLLQLNPEQPGAAGRT